MSKSPGRVLKEKGIIPSSWNLKSLSRGQKSWITKQTRTFEKLLKAPGQYSTVKVRGKRQREEAKSSGFKVSNDRAVIFNPGAGRATRRKGRIVIATAHGTKEFFYVGADTYNDDMARLKEAEGNGLANNQVWQANPDGYPINLQFRSLKELDNYVQNLQLSKPKSAKFWEIVKITERGGLYSRTDHDGEDE